MKTKLISVSLLFGLVLTACSFWGVRGNGRMRDESRKVTEFLKIEAGGAFSINVKVGQDPSLRISAEENLLGYIRTTVRGNTLMIETKKNISPRKEIRIEITTPALRYLEVSGANNVAVEGISGAEFDVELSGAGNVDLKGEVEKLRIELSGAGNIDSKKLKASEVRISVSGAASAEVYATKYLDASVSGVGSINYYGNPEKTETNISGVGSITRK